MDTTLLEAIRKSEKRLTFEQLAALCVKEVKREADRGERFDQATSANHFDYLIERELVHLGLCKCIERIEDRRRTVGSFQKRSDWAPEM